MTSSQELMIEKIIGMLQNKNADNKIPLGVSNKHIHLTKESIDILFGSGYELTKYKDLGQPGQFAAKERVCIAGRKGCFTNVRVLGPARKEDQVEVSKTDAFSLGINPPVRISGDLRDASDICVIGPKGMLVLKGSVIIAKPHIHMTPEDAKFFQVKDKDEVSVKLCGSKKVTFHNVEIRVDSNYKLEFHIDTDEANSAAIGSDEIFVDIER